MMTTNKRLHAQILAMRRTPAGKLLVRCQREPFNTESSARIVAQCAAAELEQLARSIRALLGVAAWAKLNGANREGVSAIMRQARAAMKQTGQSLRN